MSKRDREKWDGTYRDGDPYGSQPSKVLLEQQHLLPSSGRALDLAGGCGRHAIWLAEQGLTVTLADISPQGLQIARQRADLAELSIECLQIDLEEEDFPAGPWDLVISCLYLYRPLFPLIRQQLSAAGVLAVLQPTTRNLERHARPPARFLLEENELGQLAEGLEILHYEESWSVEGRHDAVLVARQVGQTK
jgi:hypothetical protein